MRRSGRPRVGVTRDEPCTGPLSLALRHRGLEPVACPVVTHLPTLDPAPLHHAVEHLAEFDWIIVSSARTVDLLARMRAPRVLPRQPRWAAVGASTATALFEREVRVATVPPEASADALLAALLQADSWPGRKVLVPRASGGRRIIAERLEMLGAEVTDLIAYRTVPCPQESIRTAWRAARADGVIFASPSAVNAFVQALRGEASLGSLAAVIAIGPTTAETLQALGVSCRVSPRADFEVVATLCSQLFFGTSTSSQH